MNEKQREYLAATARKEFEALDARHRKEAADLHEKLSWMLDGITAPAVEPVRAPPVFPDERHLYPRSNLLTLRGGQPRPRRWRSEGIVEYAYQGIGLVGTPDVGVRWLTVAELCQLREQK